MSNSSRTTELPNGLRVVTEAVPHARSASLGAWVGVGGRDEPGELAGVSHFLEHLLFKGTAGRSAHEINETVDAVGGEMNAFTGREHTAFYLRVPAEQFSLATGVLGEVLTEPALRVADVDSERQVILEELALDEDEPEDRVHTLQQAALFPDHPLGRDVGGTVATVSAINRDDIASFFEQWYRPANVVLAAAGQVDHDELVAAVSGWFRSGPAGERPRREPPGVEVEREATLVRPAEQAHVVLGWRTLDVHDPDRHALALATHVLGGGMSSRLFERVRDERGLAYSVYADLSLYQDSGCAVAYAGTSPEHRGEVLDLMASTAAELAASGLTARELEVAKGYVRGSLLLGLEDTASRMMRLASNTLVHGEVIDVDEYLARIEAVTLDDVARLAASTYGVEPCVATLQPPTGRRHRR